MKKPVKEKPKGNFFCTEPGCTSSFSRKDGLKRHLENIHGFIFCKKCDSCFKIQSEFEQHMKDVHNENIF